MSAYRTIFKVRGTGDFPFDMLRYDCCFPAKEEEMHLLTNGDPKIPRVITIAKIHTEKKASLTPGRWRSFGWDVLPDSFETYR